MNFYERLEKLEEAQGSIAKENYLITILKRVSNAEAFFRFAFNEDKYGVQEQTFKNAFGNQKFTWDHISDWLATHKFEPMADGSSYKVPDLITFGQKLMNSSGNDQEILISNFIRQCEPLKKKWFCRAILKDLRCGIQVKTVNKCFKACGLEQIKKFSLQLCGKLDVYDTELVAKKIKFPCSMECKYDGIRLQAEIMSCDTQTDCFLTSRRGKNKNADYPEIAKELREIFEGENIILDGEIISQSFQELTRKDSKSKKNYVVFDLLVDEKLKYMNRWDNLMSLFSNYSITEYKDKQLIKVNKNHIYFAEHYSCNSLSELQTYYEELNERKEEGVIIKLDDSIYERGSRKHMFKCKKVYTADLLCTGYKLGSGKRSNMVSTLCLEDKSKTIKVDVGSGIDDYTSEQLTGDLEREFVGKIVEIKYNEITETGSIRFPRFVRIRDSSDKDESDDLSQTEVRQK